MTVDECQIFVSVKMKFYKNYFVIFLVHKIYKTRYITPRVYFIKRNCVILLTIFLSGNTPTHLTVDLIGEKVLGDKE